MEYIMIGGAVTETHRHGQGAYEGDQEPARRQIQKRNDNMTDALGKPMDFKLLPERHGDICDAETPIQGKVRYSVGRWVCDADCLVRRLTAKDGKTPFRRVMVENCGVMTQGYVLLLLAAFD